MTTTTATIVFTDLVGSTEAAERAGAQAWERYRQQHFAAMREAISTNGGTEVKTIGDAFMASFASATNAVSCAVAMQKAQARINRRGIAAGLRTGISAGDVTSEDGDYFGMPVVEASRLCQIAGGGQVLVSDVVRLLDRSGAHRFESRGAFELKGIREPVAASEVVFEVEDDEAAGKTPFVGRHDERAHLSRLLEDARKGHGSVVLIGGEPGVGKTRLAEEVMAEGRATGMFTLIGHCYEMEGAPPYLPFVEGIEYAIRIVPKANMEVALGESASEVARLVPELRRLFPQTPPPLVMPPEEGRRYLLNNVRDYFERAARIQPMVMVLDDIQWADDSTLLLLEHLAARINEAPMLIVGTYRDVELDVARPLARSIEALNRRAQAERIALRRLPRDEVAALLRGLSGLEPPAALVGVVFAETEGVPFFVQEVYRYLFDEGRLFDAEGKWRSDVRVGEVEVPEGVRLVIGRRLERVAEGTRRALTAASVIGRAFTFELLKALVDGSKDALLDAVDEAERAHLIVTGEGRDTRITFAHEQIRQTLLGAMSLPRRQRMHLRVAEALEKAYANDLDAHAPDLAHHLYQAGAAADTEKTVRYLALAGDQAMSAAAFEEGLRLFTDALSILPEEGLRERAELLFKRGLAVRSLHGFAREIDDWREAIDLYIALDDRPSAARLSFEAAAFLGWAGRTAEMAEVAAAGLTLVEGERSAERCLLQSVTAGAFSWGPFPAADHDAAEAGFQDTLALARQLADPAVEGTVLRTKAIHDVGWCHWEAAVDDLRGSQLLRDAGRVYEALDLETMAMNAPWCLGNVREALDWYRRIIDESGRLGNIGAAYTAEAGVIQIALLMGGDLESFESKARALVKTGDEYRIPWRLQSYCQVAWSLFWRGEWEQARAFAGEAVALESVAWPVSGGGSMIRFVLAAHSQPGGALAILAGAEHTLPAPGRPNTYASWNMLVGAVEGLATLGERRRAASLYALFGSLPPRTILTAFEASLIQLAAAISAACGQQWDLAEEHFQTALRQAQDLPHKIAQPEVRRWYAWMLLDRDLPGDRENARTLLDEAIAMYTTIGMPKHLEIAEALRARA